MFRSCGVHVPRWPNPNDPHVKKHSSVCKLWTLLSNELHWPMSHSIPSVCNMGWWERLVYLSGDVNNENIREVSSITNHSLLVRVTQIKTTEFNSLFYNYRLKLDWIVLPRIKMSNPEVELFNGHDLNFLMCPHDPSRGIRAGLEKYVMAATSLLNSSYCVYSIVFQPCTTHAAAIFKMVGTTMFSCHLTTDCKLTYMFQVYALFTLT